MPRKQDPYATAGQKVVGLYSLLLFTGRAYSLGQLARLFGCSKQTVLRMVEQIEMTHRLRLRAWVEGRESGRGAPALETNQFRDKGAASATRRLPQMSMVSRVFLCLSNSDAIAVFAVYAGMVAAAVEELDHAQQLAQADLPVMRVVIARVWRTVVVGVVRRVAILGP